MNTLIVSLIIVAEVLFYVCSVYFSYFVGREIAIRRMEGKLREIANAHRTLKEECRGLQRRKHHRK